MANANKFLEELEKQKKKRKAEGKDTSSLEPMAPVRTDLSGSSKQVDSFFNALNTEREKLRRREEITESFDIAPTVGSVSGNKHGGRGGSFTVKSEEDDSLLDFFDRGAFRDGYQFGDVAKTILGTSGDIGVGAVKGVMKMGEGIGDAVTYGVAAAADALGFDDNAEKWRKNAQRSAIDDLFAPIDKTLDRNSVLGRTLDSASEAVGQIGGIIATGGLAGMAGAGALGATAATTGVMGLSSFGSSTGEAYKGGAETGEAELYGAIAGAADAITEMLSGGLGKGVKAVGLSHGLGGFDDIIAKKLSEKITNTIAKNAVQFGVKATGEGLEEVLAGTVQAAAKYKVYMEEQGADFSQILEDENLLEQFVVGAMASGVAQVPSLQQSNKAGTDYITGRTKNEQAVIDRVVEQRIKDAETDQGGVKLKPKERQAIEEQAAADMERGRIEIDTIEEVLGGEEYKAYQDAVKEEDALRKEYEELGALKEPTLAERTRYEELHEKASEFSSDERRTAMKTKLSERVAEMAKSDRLSESYAERSRRGEYFTEDVEKYKSDAAKKTVQNLVDAKLANNTGRTHDMVETVAKIAEDKGIVFNFTNNQKLRESGKMDAVAEGVTINGYKDAGGITVNLDSPKAWEFIVGHEVTHALEGTAEYKVLADAVKVYAQTKGEYDSRRDAITSLYAEGTDVDSELTADMVGELFTDEQFVQDLSVKHQNVFQRVFAEIKHLVKMVTAGSKEARRLEQVRRTFERAYRAQAQNQQAAQTQHSISADTQGRELTNEQREYFRESKVTDENGNLKVMYHGTPNGDFTVFRDGTYFTDSREYADKYQQPGASSLSVKKTATNPKTFEVYLDIKKPFDLSDPEVREIYINDYIKGGNAIGINPYLSDAEYDKITSIDWTEGEDLREFLQDNEYEYDGLILDEGGTGGYGDDVEYRGKSYVVFSPEQVKNVDNLNPTADPDIRFSLSAAVEESKNLIAVHNLNADKLMKSLALGGMPMPSIAIAKAEGGHENFGDISLVFDKSTIDPQASAANKVYSGDAWTPTYPRIEYKVNETVRKRVEKKIRDLVPYDVMSDLGVVGLDSSNMENTVRRNDGDMVEAYRNERAMKYAYLKDIGADVTLPTKEKSIDRYNERENGAIIHVAEVIGAEELDRIRNAGYEEMQAAEPKIRAAVAEYMQQQYADDPELRDIMTPTEPMPYREYSGYVYDAMNYLTNGIQQEVDYKAAREIIDGQTDQEAYETWLGEQFDGIVEKEGIRNNVDYFTPSGNRRSFEATHWENTLENVVRAMKESGEKGVGHFGTGNIFGAATQEMKTIDAVKKSEGRLQKLSDEEYQEIKEGYQDRFFALAARLPKNQGSFSAAADAANMLVEAVVKYKTKKGIDGYLRRESQGWANYSPDVTEELISLVNDIRAMPTQYFEAKPQRAVSFDEVAAFVIPRNADIKVKQELLNRGYSIAEYDPDIEGDRAKVLNSFEQYKFSLSDASAAPGGRGTAARDLLYQGEAEDIAPVQQVTADQFADAGNMVQAEDVAPIPGEHSEIDRLNAEYEAARAEFDALSADVQSRYAEMSPAEQEQAMADVLAAGERLQAAHDSLNAEQQSALASYSDADVPPEVDAPYYGDEQEQTMPADPMADRDEKEVGARSVKAYQYLNPEVKPYFQTEANAMLGDLRRATRGERFVNWDTGGMGSDGIWTGQPRVMSYDLAGLKDRFGYSYEQLEKGIQAIIDDDGKENNAVSKRIELLIHDRLAHGYVDAYSGAEIPADTEYLDFLREREISEYNDEAFAALMADADAFVPPIAEDTSAEVASADAAPVAEAPTADDLAGVSSAEDTEVDVLEIKSTYDKILQKKQNAEAELEEYKNQRAVRSELYQTRIAELRQKLDRKKRKDTKAAVRLGQQIARLERLAADVEADYAKRISDAEKRIARRDFELNQDHTEADKLERAYAKIDQQLALDRAAVEEEFAQRREELSAAIADKNTYIGERAKELYSELSHLKKGVRASYELGYLLDHGYDWRTLKSTLLKVNLQPEGVINPDSAEESVIREMLNEEYASRTFDLGELDGEMQDRLAELEADAEAQKAEVRKGEEKLYRKQVEARYMDEMKGAFAVGGYDLDVLLRTAKDVSGFKTVDKTPQRVNFAVFGDVAGEIMNDLTVNRVAQNETEGIRWLNQYTDPTTGVIAKISKEYHIKPGSKESAAAQMYAEGFYVDEYNEIVKYGDRELAADFPDAKVQANIKGLARDGRIRAIYDATLDAINEVRVRNAYPEIPKRDNYFLHFREMGDFFSKNGLPFNPNDMRLKDLPTDINGMTVDNKPGKPYFASEKQRKGKRTSFDLLGGLEQYLTSAKDQIYHIDDIQRHRALRNYIADDYGQANGLDSLAGLSEEEVQERIQLVFGNHLSTYAKFLNEEANILAGKTALMDRALEGVIGRRGMTFMSDLNKQVGANQVGFNVSSSLTNLLSGVQAFSKMNKGAFIKGFAQTVSNRIGGIFGRGDNFAIESSVMVRREGAKRFKTNWWQRRQDNAYALMGAVDSVTTEVIARAKHAELTGKGVSSEQAHYETDKWVSALMGDRSLGQQPHLFNSKTFGMILKYQLEVRNQLDSMFEDTIREAKLSTAQIEDAKKRNAVKAAKIASTFATLAVTQHIFGQVFESIAGYNPAFDIIEAIIKAAGWDDDEDDDDTVLDNLEQGLLSLAEDMPYYSILSGGRIPIESALPVETLIKGKDSYGNEVSRWKTAAEALPYYVLPGGYGQIKKTAAGLGMYSDEHPVAGSYTDSGNMRFPVGTSLPDVAQAAVFGQYSSANARDYFDNERKPLTEKQVDEYAKADMTIQDYWRYRDGLAEHDKLADQAEYINSLDIPTWKKNLFINNLTDRKEAIDMADYGRYGSLEEMDFAKKSPEKYKLLQDEGVTYQQYTSFDDKTKNAYEWAAKSPEKYGFIRDIGYTLDDYARATDKEKDAFTWAYNNPDKYLVSRAVSDDLFAYRSYTDDLNDIKADKDSDGKSISGSRKDKVVDYINGLDLDYGAKIILLKSEYPSEDSYNYDIIDYLNERDDISGDDMVVMLTALGFKVSDDSTVTWD